MRRADNLPAVTGQESIRSPVERVSRVHAKILIREYVVAPPNDESFEWPVALTNSKFPASRVA
jgi:hypothetical protein